MLKVNNISGGYVKGFNVIDNLSIEFSNNLITAIVGLNGSGKSTLAKMIVGMVPYISGQVSYLGKNIRNLPMPELIEMGIGYLPQGGKVFESMTVKENLMFAGIEMDHRMLDQRILHIYELFSSMDLKGIAKTRASSLSGGEKHVLGLAMAFIRSPQFLILDEPFAGVSPKMKKELIGVLQNVQQLEQFSILIIEQNLNSVFELSDIAYFLIDNKLEQVNGISDAEKIFETYKNYKS